ncbi:hypothetical protein RZR97_11925 [Hydrogenimonas thermophila]|uniref:hypothetical protein n=1 Tax=Hydrogenimonas thermophila TaxID=223786 RepID=UPI002936F2F6|nr:hypothetical protein [Hydrogenimonas thermophila]WOE69805.1 hypothetical protein RZR91_11930 [Hydrogenimonas thermophila]WOE72320.1 hypothetical protein RZR97_11925 [Hydrogenimonas thermophila]
MRHSLEKTLTNPWVLWSLFGAGFFLPYLFVLFLPSIGMLAWRHVRSEFSDTTEFWIKHSCVNSLDIKKEEKNETNHTKSPVPALSPISFP